MVRTNLQIMLAGSQGNTKLITRKSLEMLEDQFFKL